MLPAQGFLLNCLVMKLEGGSGGPVRVIAVKDYPVAGRLFEQDDGSSGINYTIYIYFQLRFIFVYKKSLNEYFNPVFEYKSPFEFVSIQK